MNKYVELKTGVTKEIKVYTHSNYNAQYVKTLLAINGVRQSMLSDILGVAQAAISKRINGIFNWEPYELLTLSDLLGCTVEDIINPSEEQIKEMLTQQLPKIGV